MKTPNLQLMRMYGNEQVFFQKTAESPMARREELMAAARAELDRLAELQTAAMHLEAQKMNARARLLELGKMSKTIENAHHTRAQIILPENDLPVGMTDGMVRLASAIGTTMAKTADGWEKARKFVETGGGLRGKTLGVHNAIWKPVALAGAAGTLYTGNKALKQGLHWASEEPSSPTYNAGGNQLAQDVNEYGYAQRRLAPAYY